jgi:hypothetical protein
VNYSRSVTGKLTSTGSWGTILRKKTLSIEVAVADFECVAVIHLSSGDRKFSFLQDQALIAD